MRENTTAVTQVYEDHFFGSVELTGKGLVLNHQDFLSRGRAATPDHFFFHLKRLFGRDRIINVRFDSQVPNLLDVFDLIRSDDISLIGIDIGVGRWMTFTIVLLEGKVIVGGEWSSTFEREHVPFYEMILRSIEEKDLMRKTIIVSDNGILNMSRAGTKQEIREKLKKLIGQDQQAKA